MNLSLLLKLCESENSAVCMGAKRKLRYHAVEVLPKLVEAARSHLAYNNKETKANLWSAVHEADKVKL